MLRHLTERLVATQQDKHEVIAFRTLALSRLAAQHEEILRLRAAARAGKVRDLSRGSRPGAAPAAVTGLLPRWNRSGAQGGQAWDDADADDHADDLDESLGHDHDAGDAESFDARNHCSGSSRSIWYKSLSTPGALEDVERSRRETVVLSDR